MHNAHTRPRMHDGPTAAETARIPQRQQVIQPGTVSSRIKFLATLERPVLPPESDYTRPRGESRATSGRRRSPRFAEPASRPSYTNKHPKANHSFDPLQYHATSGPAPRFERTPGLSGQLKPGAVTHSPQLAKIDSRPLPTIRSYGQLTLRQSGNDALKSSKSVAQIGATNSPSHCQDPKDYHHAGQTAFSDDVIRQRTDEWRQAVIDSSIREPDSPASSRYRDTTDSRSANSTRKQSVRQLFLEYGIQTPQGLLSEEGPTDDTIELPQRPRLCHKCKFTNHGGDYICGQCKHHMCTKCDQITYRSVDAGDIQARGRHHVVKQGKDTSVARIPSHPALRLSGHDLDVSRHRAHDERDPDQTIHKLRREPRELPMETIFHGIDTRHRKTSDLNQAKVELIVPATRPMSSTEKAGRVRIRDQRWKDNPFVVADNWTALERKLPQLADKPQLEHSRTKAAGKRRVSLSRRASCSSSCPATHDGHTPYRHSISCVQKRHTENEESLLPETDPAKRALLSAQSFIVTPILTPVQLTSQPATQQLLPPQVSMLHAAISTQVASSPFAAQDYVECHGYPRTGHGMEYTGVSPIELATIGQCQHCLNDCQCAACQDLPHSVRCCIHPSHRGQIKPHRHAVHDMAEVSNRWRFVNKHPALVQPELESSVQREGRRKVTIGDIAKARTTRERRRTLQAKNSAPLLLNVVDKTPAGITIVPSSMLAESDSPLMVSRQHSIEVSHPKPRRKTKDPMWINGTTTNIMEDHELPDELVWPISKILKNAKTMGDLKRSVKSPLKAKPKSIFDLRGPTTSPAGASSSKSSSKLSLLQRLSGPHVMSVLLNRQTAETTPLLVQKLEREQHRQKDASDRHGVIEKQKQKGKTWAARLRGENAARTIELKQDVSASKAKQEQSTKQGHTLRKDSDASDEHDCQYTAFVLSRAGTAGGRPGIKRSSAKAHLKGVSGDDGRLGIKGISIVIHIDGQEDLILAGDIQKREAPTRDVRR